MALLSPAYSSSSKAINDSGKSIVCPIAGYTKTCQGENVQSKHAEFVKRSLSLNGLGSLEERTFQLIPVENIYDPNAVAVKNNTLGWMGWIPKEISREIKAALQCNWITEVSFFRWEDMTHGYRIWLYIRYEEKGELIFPVENKEKTQQRKNISENPLVDSDWIDILESILQ